MPLTRVDLSHVLRATDANDVTVADAQVSFFEDGTTTPVTVYADAAGTTPRVQPISCDAEGAMPAVYTAPRLMRVRFTDVNGADLPGSPFDGFAPGGGGGGAVMFGTTREASEAILPVGIGVLTFGCATVGDGGEIRGITGADVETNPFGGNIRILGNEACPQQFEATADGSTDDLAKITSTLGHLRTLGGSTLRLPGSYAVSDTIEVDFEASVTGIGPEVSRLIGTTDNPVIKFLGEGRGIDNRNDYTHVERFQIEHIGATTFAMVYQDAAYLTGDTVHIDCEGGGYGGLLLGDGGEDPETQAYLASLENYRIDRFTGFGVFVNTRGSTLFLRNFSVRSLEVDAIAIRVQSEGVVIEGGQCGCSDGTAISFYNPDAGRLSGGSVSAQTIEKVNEGRYWLTIDGVAKFNSVHGFGIRANLAANDGTLCFFGNTNDSTFEFVVENPDGGTLAPGEGGTSVEWGANSVRCIATTDWEGAQAPVVVHPDANEPELVIRGRRTVSALSLISTQPNLIVRCPSGLLDAPAGFEPVFNGRAWNIQRIRIDDDDIATLTLPSDVCNVTIMPERRIDNIGKAGVQLITGSNLAVALENGGEFGVAAGVPTGLTGANGYLTLFVSGDVAYLENRIGIDTDFTILYTTNGEG